MTIKISQLGNVATIQGNVLLPIVSNITGTLTTVQANLDQLGTYILGNAGNVIPLASNTYSLGNSTTWWKDLWISNTTIYIGGVPLATAGGRLTFDGANVGTTGLDTYTGNVSGSGITLSGATGPILNVSVINPGSNIAALQYYSIAGGSGSGASTFVSDAFTPRFTFGSPTWGNGYRVGDVITVVNPYVGNTYSNATLLVTELYGIPTPSIFVGNTAYKFGGDGALTTPGNILLPDSTAIYNEDSSTAVFTSNIIAATTRLSLTDGGNASVYTDAGAWTFDLYGTTTLPGNITLPDNTAIYNFDANTAVFTSNVNSDATSLYLTDAGNVAVYASGSVVLETNSNGNVSQQWSFNDTGSVTFPYGSTLNTTSGGAIALGQGAEDLSQGNYAISIGYSTGSAGPQGEDAIAIGRQSGRDTQGESAVAIGVASGIYTQGTYAVAIGFVAGENTQGNNSVAIGRNAGSMYQGANAVAIGTGTGASGDRSVAIGSDAGYALQGYSSIAVGQAAGLANQSGNAIAIGTFSGNSAQGYSAIAIGEKAGEISQGNYTVAIGRAAGQTNQANNSIIINATGSALNLTTNNAFVVAPVRNDTGNISTSMYYNTTTKEVTYTSSGAFLPTYSGNVGSLFNVGDFIVFGGNITAGFALPTTAYANVIFNGVGFANSSSQLNIQNVDSVGTRNSADFIATAPNGTDTSKYIDMGINGNNFVSSAWTISGKNDGYVYINSGNLTLGTDTPNTTVKVHVGGTLAANVVATFSNSNVTIGGNLIVSNTYVPTANNSAGTAGQIAWDSGYVYICIATNTWKRANIATW